MSCVQIRLTTAPSIINSEYISGDGFVYIDLPVNFDLRETKRVTELNDINQISFDYTLEFDAPDSPKNREIFSRFQNPNVLDADRDPIPVQVVSGSHVLEDNDIYCTNYTSTISLKLRLTLDHWARQMSKNFVCDIDLGSFDFTCTNIKNNIENNYLYEDGDPGFWFPLIDFGDLRLDPTPTIFKVDRFVNPREYWRPCFHVKKLLDDIFCQAGWNFSSPLFESDYGRRILAYLIRKDYGTNLIGTLTFGGTPIEINFNQFLDAKATNTGNTLGFEYLSGTASRVFFDVINFDSGNNFTTSTAQSYEPGEGITGLVDITGSIGITIRNSDLPFLEVSLCYLIEASDTEVKKINIQVERFENLAQDAQVTFTIDSPGVPVTNIDEIAVLITAQDLRGTGSGGAFGSFSTTININTDSFIEYKGVRNFIPEAYTVNLNSLIDCELTALELLKGLIHPFNLKIVTDFVNRTVYLYPPYQADFFGEVVEGFYLDDTIEDISGLLDPRSKNVTTPDLNQPGFRRVKYADSTDFAIEKAELENELWSKQYQINDNMSDEESPIENELFEPTLNRNRIVHIPQMKKRDTRHTWDIEPRLLLAFGNVRQILQNQTEGPKLRKCTLTDNVLQLIPTASMYVPDTIGLGLIQGSATSLTAKVDENLVFGVNPEIEESEPEETLFTKTWERYLIETFNNLSIQYLVDLNRTKFLGIDFRKNYHFYHLGRLISARMIEIEDFSHCKRITTPVNFVPKIQDTDICATAPEIVEPTQSNCQNYPQLLVSIDYDTETFYFSLGGVQNGAITSVIFRYQLASGGPVVTLTNDTPVTASLSGVTDVIEVWAVVVYETPCPAKYTPKVTTSLCADAGVSFNSYLSFTFGGGASQVEIVPELNVTDPNVDLTIISSEYNAGLGAGWVAFTYPDPIPQFSGMTKLWDEYVSDVDFRFTVQVGTCPSYQVTGTHDFLFAENRNVDCDGTDAFLVWTDEGTNQISFQVDGNIGSADYLLRIVYRNSSDSGLTWSNWIDIEEDEIVTGLLFQAKLVIEFDNDVCPQYTYQTQIDPADCDCATLDALSLVIDSDENSLLSYTLGTPGGCTTPAISLVTWYRGPYQSATADTVVGTGPTYQQTQEGDFKVVIQFTNGCQIESNVADIPFVQGGEDIAEP